MFGNLTFTFPSLYSWVNQSLVHTLPEQRDQVDIGDAYDLRHLIAVHNPIREEITLADADLTISVGTGMSQGSGSFEITETALLTLRSDDGKHFDTFDETFLHPLRQYFTMALGTPVYPIEMRGTLVEDIAAEEGEPPPTVEIYQPYPHFREDTEINSTEILFHLDNVDIEKSLTDWLEHFRAASQLHKFYFGYRESVIRRVSWGMYRSRNRHLRVKYQSRVEMSSMNIAI